MSNRYRITFAIGKMEASKNPPAFIGLLFPSGDSPSEVVLSEEECIVTFDTPQTPADLGPLVRVELLPTP